MAKAFTITYSQLVKVIFTPIQIHHPLPPNAKSRDPSMPVIDCNAIWDTGSTITMITEKVARALRLIPFSSTTVTGINISEDKPVYKIGIWLPNRVGLRSINVAECKAINGPYEVLIGMDIISMGDFSISYDKGRTVFSFRMPSIETIDFTGKAKSLPVVKGKSPGRNDPCPCGSGLKYKNCHGKLNN